jgi:predicted nucleotidyltransferase
VAELLGRVLKEQYGVRRVLLVGSLARGDFRLGSDIDLAVEGLADADLFSAGAELERRAQGLEVDLVPLEDASPAFRLAAEREGIEPGLISTPGSSARFALLAAAIRRELTQLAGLIQEAEEFGRQFAATPPTSLKIRGLGDIVHDFYTGAERLFEKVASELDGGVPAGRSWHRDLLLSMTLEVPSRRPALLSDATARELEAFLRFRHLFRNVYGFELEWTRLGPLLQKGRGHRRVPGSRGAGISSLLDSAASAPE